LVNLFNGQPHAPAPPPYQDPDSKLFTRQWVRDAAGLIAVCPFNGDALDQHLAKLKSDSQSAKLPREAHITAVHRYYNDRACAQRIKYGRKALGDGLYEYHPDYRSQYSGRLSEVGGGLQSCSRVMKQAVFDGIKNVRNYDLKASQAYILLQELEDANLNANRVGEYLHTPNAATQYAKRLGIGKDTFKRCLYATIMGAQFNDRHLEHNAIFDALLDEISDPETAARMLRNVFEVLDDLKNAVDAWHSWLLDRKCLHSIAKRKRKHWLENACGMQLCLDEENPQDRKRRAAAFILQGREAAYVHRLTLLAATYGFMPISNQHDGLVTIGEIPAEAQERAKEQSGFRYARLEEKAFC
jgi:hypothetical protein